MRPLTGFRVAAWACALVPAAILAWRILHADLTANPVEFLERYTGLWSLRLLLLTLAMTPLRTLTGRIEFVQVRRLLGLWSFTWITAHFAIFLTFDLEWSPTKLAEEIVKRTYITLGFAAWLLLVPLAITSTHGWQRRLKRRWKALHRLIYVASVLGALHFLWLVKSDIREPALYLGIAAVLLAARLRAPKRHEAGRGERAHDDGVALEREAGR
jgi:sulfoxide reductase heme-binding subunit YedZ